MNLCALYICNIIFCAKVIMQCEEKNKSRISISKSNLRSILTPQGQSYIDIGN